MTWTMVCVCGKSIQYHITDYIVNMATVTSSSKDCFANGLCLTHEIKVKTGLLTKIGLLEAAQLKSWEFPEEKNALVLLWVRLLKFIHCNDLLSCLSTPMYIIAGGETTMGSHDLKATQNTLAQCITITLKVNHHLLVWPKSHPAKCKVFNSSGVKYNYSLCVANTGTQIQIANAYL